MEYQAKWGTKGFLISAEKIVTFDGFSTSVELDESDQNVKKKQTINMSVTYVKAAGTDPRSQFTDWETLVGDTHPLYISGRRFGPPGIQLKKVDLSGVKLSNDGTFLMATIALSFEEHAIPKASDARKNLQYKNYG